MILEIAAALELDKPGGDGLLDRRAHRALSRASACQALSRHHRSGKRRACRALLRRGVAAPSGRARRRSVGGRGVGAGRADRAGQPPLGNAVALSAERPRHLQGRPAFLQGRRRHPRQDRRDRRQGGESPSAHRRVRLLLHQRRHARHRPPHGCFGDHHERARPFPDERGPAEVHRLSAAGAGERFAVRRKLSASRRTPMSPPPTPSTPCNPPRGDRPDRPVSPARCATTRCRRMRGTMRAGICSTPSA